MAEVDTSSYRLPAQPGALDVLGKVQGIESQRIGIERNKLAQINQGYEYLLRELNSLPADATVDQYREFANNAVKLKLVTPEMATTFLGGLPSDPAKLQVYRNSIASKLASTQEAINLHYGVAGMDVNGQTRTPTVSSPFVRGGAPRPAGNPIQAQPPISQETVDTDPNSPNYGSRGTLGAVAPTTPAGTQQQPGGLPGQYEPLPVRPVPTQSVAPPAPPRGGLPVAPVAPRVAPIVPNGMPNPLPAGRDNFAQRFDPVSPTGRIPTSLPPGEGEALTASAGTVAREREASANFQREVFPLREAIGALERLGPQGTGPGTDTFNTFKSFIATNIPGIDPNSEAWKSVQDYDKAKKYLQDYVNSSGISSQSQGHLAAAITGNPSTSISNLAAVDVAKAALALRRMKQAVYLEFAQTGLPDNRFTKWAANRNNEIDPRAFSFDLLGREKADALLKSLNQRDLAKFMATYEMAKSAGVFAGGTGGH